MDFKVLNSRAWTIRKNAAIKYNCPVMEIIWRDCLVLAQKTIKIDSQVKKGNSMKIFKEYHICRTGKLKQHYTLYITSVIVYSDKFFNETCAFYQNLGYDAEVALKKVEAMVALLPENTKYTIDFHNSKKREYCDLKAFGFEWKKTVKGFTTDITRYYIDPYMEGDLLKDAEERNKVINNFWQTWREKKSLLKENGFSVFKDEDSGSFKLFFRNCPNDEMYKRMSLIDQKHEVKGKFVGNEGDKIKDIQVTVERVYINKNAYGEYQNIVFTSVANNRIKSKYTGNRYTFKEGQKVLLSGTIKDNSIENFINTSTLTRISIK